MSYALRNSDRRGVILITAIWVIIALLALVLIFAQQTRVELVASANRASGNQAATVELGAEQYVLAAVDGCNGDALSVLNTPAEQMAIGGTGSGTSTSGGYFWILQTYYDNDNSYAFGITDENSKLNLNVASDTELSNLPGVPQDVADSIFQWRGGAATSTKGQGADSSYYGTTPRPYSLKSNSFESIDEVYLIKDMTDTILYGYDLDHNGMLDANEQNAAGPASAFNSGSDASRGIFPFVTVWGQEPNTDASGKARVNISMVNADSLRSLLTTAKFSSARVTQIVERAEETRTFRNIFDFALRTQMSPTELAKIQYSLTTSQAKTLTGLINVNTAPAPVLLLLPGLIQQDVDNIVAQRPTATSGTTSSASNINATWLLTAIGPKAVAIGSQITGRSFFYSADIVAVATDGNPPPSNNSGAVGGNASFKRVRIVVDARSSPPVIVYRKDLTHLGWPLDPAILTALKQHRPLPSPSGLGTGGASGLSQQL